MLFQDHKDQFDIVEGEVVLFTGGFIVNKQAQVLGFLVGVKQKNGQIRTYVTYHRKGQLSELKTKRVLSPAEFEKFLNNTAMAITSRTKNSLVEFSFRTRVLDDPFSAFLEDEEKDALLQLFLIKTIKGVSREDAYHEVIRAIKQLVQQRI